jgi:hypothetical protein
VDKAGSTGSISNALPTRRAKLVSKSAGTDRENLSRTAPPKVSPENNEIYGDVSSVIAADMQENDRLNIYPTILRRHPALRF